MRFRSSLRALAAVLVALAFLASACGSSDDSTETSSGDDAGTDSSDDSGDSSGDSDSAGDTGSSDGDDAPADDADTSGTEDDDGDDGDDVDVFGGGDADAFCAAYAENETLSDEFSPLDPEQTRTFMTRSRDLLAEAIGNAPGDLQPDLNIILDGLVEMNDLLEGYDYDFFAAADDIEGLSNDAEINAASDRVDAWIEANCPEAMGDNDDASSLTDELTTPDGLEAILGSEAGRELFIQGLVESADGQISPDQAECLVENLDVEMMSALATDPDSVGAQGAVDLLDVLAGCGIPLDALG